MEPPKIWRERRYRYQALGSKCKDCGEKTFPYVNYCPKCASTNIEEYKLPTKGQILLFTDVAVVPPEMKDWAPYVIALVELDDGTKVIGQVVDCEATTLTEGMKVRRVLRVLAKNGDEGLIKYGFKFVPDN